MKIHATNGKCGWLARFVLTAGPRGDAPQAGRRPADFEPGRLGVILADAAYDSNAIRERCLRLRAESASSPTTAAA